MATFKSGSISAKQLSDIQDKINSSPNEQAAFVESPKDYLAKEGVSLPDEFQSDLERNLSEMTAGPVSFKELAAMNNKALGIMISIRIPF